VTRLFALTCLVAACGIEEPDFYVQGEDPTEDKLDCESYAPCS